ncbi:F0F1 ATP synthase subunit A [Streptococcus macacae]|uniref:ATP synthase subunit a n=1 Tax=Streptococcus macacae NCTC 11558 TaxID=764298 RepID=G5JWJ3_9STRE|nr:F0F1 ATP synthase subunit A [Streptococcus macacae]EHJ52068.1 ATP synthase F0, A subunit [Streptococcus macacae NCTC 11558]SUN78773.1 F0F1 ATP synthase a chain [Streptococcus macacae NCTC 11558]
METTVNPTVHFLGITFDLTILVMSLLTVVIAFGLIFWATRRMALKPKGKQGFIEFIYDFVQGVMRPVLGKYSANYSLFIFTLFFFILIANNVGLLAKLTTKEYNFWSSPTANFMVDLTLSLMVACVVHIEGIRKRGLKKYLKSYLSPYPAMLPMNLLEQFTNVISLALRLFGNIFAGEIVMSLLVSFAHYSAITGPIGFILNMIWTAFSIFISCIQAYVFIILTSTYLGNKVNVEDEEE